MSVDVFLNTDSPLRGSAELDFGLRALRRNLQAGGSQLTLRDFSAEAPEQGPAALLPAGQAPQVLVVLNPALLATDQLLPELLAALAGCPDGCAAPADPRGASGEWQIDYASLPGFERYVARRQTLPIQQPASDHEPWLYLVRRATLTRLAAQVPGLRWNDVPRLLPGGRVVAARAFVHSYADYQAADRREMLDLIPAGVSRLVDVGGGQGLFAHAFQQARQGQAVLVEPHAEAVALARGRGVQAIQARFDALTPAALGRVVDCISFLDVLEHLEEPLQALQHANSLLPPGGHVLLSVPNVGHWSVVQDLLGGRFDYLPLGILCCTHLRFYTERSLRQLLDCAGFQVQAWRNQPSPMPAALAQALSAAQAAGLSLDTTSLGTDAFHVLATKR